MTSNVVASRLPKCRTTGMPRARSKNIFRDMEEHLAENGYPNYEKEMIGTAYLANSLFNSMSFQMVRYIRVRR